MEVRRRGCPGLGGVWRDGGMRGRLQPQKICGDSSKMGGRTSQPSSFRNDPTLPGRQGTVIPSVHSFPQFS